MVEHLSGLYTTLLCDFSTPPNPSRVQDAFLQWKLRGGNVLPNEWHSKTFDKNLATLILNTILREFCQNCAKNVRRQRRIIEKNLKAVTDYGTYSAAQPDAAAKNMMFASVDSQ